MNFVIYCITGRKCFQMVLNQADIMKIWIRLFLSMCWDSIFWTATNIIHHTPFWKIKGTKNWQINCQSIFLNCRKFPKKSIQQMTNKCGWVCHEKVIALTMLVQKISLVCWKQSFYTCRSLTFLNTSSPSCTLILNGTTRNASNLSLMVCLPLRTGSMLYNKSDQDFS